MLLNNSFVIKFKSVNIMPPALFFLKDCFGYLGSFVFPYSFRINFSTSVKNATEPVGITLTI